jgi:hypothetical protein
LTSGWTIGGVTLPLAPTKLSKQHPPTVEIFDTDGLDSDIIVPGKGVHTLMLQGSIYVSGQTNAQLIANYLVPLDALIGTEVAVSSPDNQFDGLWVFDWSYDRVAEGLGVRYTFSIKLLRGLHHIIL